MTLLAFAGVLVGAAWGAPTLSSCSTHAGTEAPNGYDAFACNSVCAVSVISGSDYRLLCDIDKGSTTGGGAWAITDYSAVDTEVVYGLATDGNQFCCFVDDPSSEVEQLVLNGSSLGNALRLVDGAESWSKSLSVGCEVDGEDGADTLEGSLTVGCEYLGKGGADIVTLNGAGADLVRLAGGNDTATGDSTANEIHGGADSDTIDALGGDDDVFGDDGNDNISCGPGADVAYGGNGADNVCGGGGTGDNLNGGVFSGSNTLPQNDLMWAPPGSVSPTGSVAGSAAQCGDSGAGFGSWAGTACGSAPCCTYNLTSKPGGCP